MKKSIVSALCGVVLSVPVLVMAEEVRHYEGKSVESLSQALAYFEVYNEKFADLLEGELTPEKMARIHEMSYTMENALGRINQEMDGLAETLESMHLASESADPETVSKKGKQYLDTARQIVGGSE